MKNYLNIFEQLFYTNLVLVLEHIKLIDRNLIFQLVMAILGMCEYL